MNRYDSEKIYCRMLGHHINFDYCRKVNNGLPCRKVLDCWFERLPIEKFIQQQYTVEEINTIFAPPKDKIISLFDLIQQAKERIK